MASKQATVDFILEQMAEAGDVSARKMFGEFGVYCGGKVVALVCDDQLFVKPTAAGKAFIGKVTEGLPYPGAKPWFLVAGNRWENGDWLAELIRVTARELPMPVRKVKKKAKPKAAKSKLAKPKTAKAKQKPSAKPKAKPRPTRQPKKTPRRA
jgi:DNA transformation protein and related proteins